jgi:hypothetical protein
VHERASLTEIVQIEKSSAGEKHREASKKRSIAIFCEYWKPFGRWHFSSFNFVVRLGDDLRRTFEN